ncbi:hypothetical protein MCGE09_00638 [Thaumarchaeota archaeon SCGC AB-539-E09]|nr:hypothetical protein MCGE09_00638 [Thaumarchaeota archaeon SCGC AB-539-E09]
MTFIKLKFSVLKFIGMLGTLGIVLFITVSFSGILEQRADNLVILEIDYIDNWNATVSNGDEFSLSRFGKIQMNLVDLTKEDWIITVRAQKQDGSMNVLIIRIRMQDGTVLDSVSTSEPYGTAELTVIIR